MPHLTLEGLRGRNGWDTPSQLPLDMAVELLNLDLYDGGIARKRLGSTALSLTGVTFVTAIACLLRHVPGSSDAAAELWGIDAQATPVVARLTGGTTWASVTLKDAIATRPQDTMGASLNGKLYLAYDSTVNRLHVYDPGMATPSARRVGLDRFAAAPTVANTGSGSYAAVLRYYRARNLEIRSSVEYRRSEPSASVSFTPSGSGTHARVTRPTAISEDETHWMIEVSLDNATWFELAGASGANAIAIGTTTFDDNAATGTYASGTAATADGYYYLPPSVKDVVSDGNRLLMLGAHETSATGVQTTPKNNRVWFTPVLGTTSAVFFDDERVPTALSDGTAVQSYIDLDENDGGFGVALRVLGAHVIVFKNRQIWALQPTGSNTTPYRRVVISKRVGALGKKSVIEGEDESGNPCLYFLAHDGPWRLGVNGLQYLGYDVKDIWDTVNFAAANRISHGVYDADVKQVLWWVATSANDDPNTVLVFDVTEGQAVMFANGRPTPATAIRYGWTTWTGGLFPAARCSVMFASTVGATMSTDLRPYVGRSAAAQILKGRVAGQTSDNGTAYQAYVDSREILSAPGQNLAVTGAELQAEESTDVTLQLTLTRDYGIQAVSFTSAVLTKGGASQTRVLRAFDDAQSAEAKVLQIRLGDASAVAALWVIDRLVIAVNGQEHRFGRAA